MILLLFFQSHILFWFTVWNTIKPITWCPKAENTKKCLNGAYICFALGQSDSYLWAASKECSVFENLQTREAAATAFEKQLQSWVVSLLCLIQFRNAISCTVAIFIVYFLLYSMWRVCTCLIFFCANCICRFMQVMPSQEQLSPCRAPPNPKPPVGTSIIAWHKEGSMKQQLETLTWPMRRNLKCRWA